MNSLILAQSILENDFIEMVLWGIGIFFIVIFLFIFKIGWKKKVEREVQEQGPLSGMNLVGAEKLKQSSQLTEEEKAAVRRSVAKQMLQQQQEAGGELPPHVQEKLNELLGTKPAGEGGGLSREEAALPANLRPFLKRSDDELEKMLLEGVIKPAEFKQIQAAKAGAAGD